MTWTAFHNRGETLRTVIMTADLRRDATLPMDVDGVAETFGGELSLLAALQLKWHTRLAGHIERQLVSQPMDLGRAVESAWSNAADELAGVREILDHYRAHPTDDDMAAAMTKATAKEHQMLATMAGRASVQDASAAPIGARIETRARHLYRGVTTIAADQAPASDEPRRTLLERLKALVAA